ncbi:MAG: L,D-transpeptidase family protein [Candidatus Kaiserbacteria bacterium]|nr:L,D-transpeptidase family protein [Candidatus Kaiserbacteria bacterium]
MGFVRQNRVLLASLAVAFVAVLAFATVWHLTERTSLAIPVAGDISDLTDPIDDGTATSTTPAAPAAPEPSKPKIATYIEVTDSCGPYWGGTCVNARSGPGTDYPAVLKLRKGIVLEVDPNPVTADGHDWYKIVFNEWIRYPDRLAGDLYVAGDYVRVFQSEAASDLPAGSHPSTNKRIVVDRSEQKLYAYEGDTLFMEEKVSTGLDLTPTPRGQFVIYRKSPTRYMQGPIPGISDQEYDLPGVPWDLYFTNEGGAIHGAYWHDHFGEQWSHGCVNLPLDSARKLYEWADLGTPVTVHD